MKRKAFSLFMVLAMIVGLFSGLTMTASATEDGYTVTFDTTNVTVTPTSGTTTNGELTFTTTLNDSDQFICSVTANGSATITTNTENSSYTVSNVTEDTTVTVIATTAYTGQTTDGYYTIGTAAQLAELASKVNDDNNNITYSNSQFALISDINLSNTDSYGSLNWTGGTNWTPIGGQWGSNSGTPSGYAFSGIFNGKSHTISGLNVNISSKSGLGLFGYVNGGIIGNLTVTGSVTGTYAAIGGLVGYTNGSLVNCTSNVEVTATGSSNVGGLAGIVENTSSDSTITVSHCNSTKNVSASKRIGGLIGGAYAAVTGGVQVDGCSVLDGDNSTEDIDVYASSTAYKTFVGGLIGYCEACVSNCLVGENVTVSANGSGGHRMGGIVGILSGYGSAKGKLAECVFLGTITNYNSNTSYDGAICVPESGTYMTNCFWLDSNLSQNTSYNATNVIVLTEAQMKGSATIDGTNYIGYFLNQAPSWNSAYNNEWTCGTEESPAYPYVTPMTERTMAQLVDYGTGTSYTGNDTAYAGSVVYYDSTAASGGDGTADTPYNSFSDAVDHLGSNTYLCVKSAVSVSDYTAKASSLSGKTIARSYTYTAPIFTVGSNQTLNLTGVTIDGNDSGRKNETMILIQGGTVTVDANSTLKNNHTISRDSAVRVEDSGSLTINGSVKGNVSALGGVIYVEHGSTFNLGTADGVETSINKKQLIYLDNTSGLSDSYVTINVALTNNLFIECSNPYNGQHIARKDDNISVSATYLKYNTVRYNIVGPTGNWFNLNEQTS